ncbi:MAG: hypothetical protein ACM31L_20620 [Actinomycetota bacterium]
MATIAPRKNDKGQVIGWQAKIRRRGLPVQSKTFESRKAAEDWGTIIEAEMIRGVHVDRSLSERHTFGEVIQGYIDKVAPTHKGGQAESLRLQRFVREEAEVRQDGDVEHRLSVGQGQPDLQVRRHDLPMIFAPPFLGQTS